jgi:transcriptional regulator with PAS, ATPase and Fis domain
MGSNLINPHVGASETSPLRPAAEMQATLSSLYAVLKKMSLPEQQALEVDDHLQEIFRQVHAFDISDKSGQSHHALQLKRLALIPSPPISRSNRLTFCSPAMHQLMQMAERAAGCDVPILISGETGVGKELIAHYVHLNSSHRLGPLVPFNCAAIPRELFESHLFGHRQGAFTGATREQVGVIRTAAGGTLLLDEVGELPLELQPKLLRFLQEGEVQPVGEGRPTQVQVRVIALTNRDLKAEVAANRFRADLYYRLNIIPLVVPPLRQRREDIPVLISYFMEKYGSLQGGNQRLLAPEALACLVAYPWPGNVRELSNLLLRLLTISERNAIITLNDLPLEVRQPSLLLESSIGTDLSGCASLACPMDISLDLMLDEAIVRVERHYVRGALLRHDGSFSKAARQLGLSTFGLRKKYRRLFTTQDQFDNLSIDPTTELTT